MKTLRNHLRAVIRGLAARPGFSVVVVSILALAIGGNAMVFSLVDAAFIDPLPYRDADRLVTVDVLSTKGFYISTSIPNYRDWRDRGRAFERWGASAGWDLTLTGNGPAEKISAQLVFGDLFTVLGIEPALGRVFPAAETEPGADALVVLGHGFWTRQLGADPAVLGKTITLEGRPHVVVGVLEAGIGYPSPETDVYVPMGTFTGLPWDDRYSSFGTRAVARLLPGTTIEQAQQDLDRVHREIAELEGRQVASPEVSSLEDHFVGASRAHVWLLLSAVVCVLLIATANITNLFLVRNEARGGELAVRRALGAGRWQVAGPILAEGVVLALVGGALGLALTSALTDVVTPLLAQDLPTWIVDRVAVSWGVAAFTLALAAVVGILASLLPALAGGASDLAVRLREGAGRGSSESRSRLRSFLVTAQVAAAVILLVGASLLFTSLQELRTVDLGFDPGGVLTARVSAPKVADDDKQQWLQFYESVEDRVERLPGVRSASLSLLVPLSQRSWEMVLHPEGRDPQDPEAGESVLFGIVSEGYFDTMGVPLLRGRSFLPSDRTGSIPVAVIDETMAAKFWPGQDPLGQRITIQETTEAGDPLYRTVVGVATNVHHYTVGEPSRIQVYVPFKQSGERYGMDLTVVAQTTLAPDLLAEPLRNAVTEIDPTAAVFATRTLQGLVDEALATQRTTGLVVVAFATLALILATLGVFGLISWFVVQRLHEIGVRMALGADGKRVALWVSARALRLTGLGVLLGCVGATALGGLLRSFLFEVDPLSPAHYLAPAVVILLAALLASLLPAREAVRADPTEILRS